MFLKHTAPAILWSAFILLLCVLPGRHFPEPSWHELLQFDKLVHFFLYACLVLFWLVGLTKQWQYPKIKDHLRTKVVLACWIYGLVIELIQLELATGRSFEWYDIVANTVGVLVGLLLFRRIYLYWPK